MYEVRRPVYRVQRPEQAGALGWVVPRRAAIAFFFSEEGDIRCCFAQELPNSALYGNVQFGHHVTIALTGNGTRAYADCEVARHRYGFYGDLQESLAFLRFHTGLPERHRDSKNPENMSNKPPPPGWRSITNVAESTPLASGMYGCMMHVWLSMMTTLYRMVWSYTTTAMRSFAESGSWSRILRTTSILS